MVDAIVLAGGTIPDSEQAFRDATGVDCKSLVPLAGRIMVGHVIAALRTCDRVGRVVVIGHPRLAGHPDCAAADMVLPEAGGRSENLYQAIDALPDARQVLMVTSDIPLATGAHYADLLDHFGPEVELGYTIVRAEAALAAFGDRPPPPPDDHGRAMPNWVTVTVRDGRFTGTPCMLFQPDALRRCQSVIKRIFDDREMGNVVGALRAVFGTLFLARVGLALRCPWLGGLVSVAAIEQRMTRGLGICCRAYVSPHPELAFDVDHLSDVPLAERVLTAR
ncbi:MAG: nucleotidyltransferase family protein [Armatimonadetes bacterium]|nr:nucleotidyltransferase family protein [Armatimonadota bacterium]